MKHILAALAAGIAFAGSANAAIFASGATTENVTSFGSGVLTGAPDGGGAFLSNTFDPPTLLGSITWEFADALIDGAGDDLRLYEVAAFPNETFTVGLSADGMSFTTLGEFDSSNLLIDIAGLFMGPFLFVRVTNTSAVNSPDFDAIEGFHLASEIPVPAALPLMIAGLGAVGALTRRRAKKVA